MNRRLCVVSFFVALCACGALFAEEHPYAGVSVFRWTIQDLARERGVSLAEASKLMKSVGITGFDCAYDDARLSEIAAAGLTPVNLFGRVAFRAADGGAAQTRAFLAAAERHRVPRVMVIPDDFTDGVPNEEEFRLVIAGLRRFVAAAEKSGVAVMVETFGNRKNPCSYAAYVKRMLDEVPGLRFALDTGNLQYAGHGGDILEVARCASNRIEHVHVKDWKKGVTPCAENKKESYETLGLGAVPNEALVRYAQSVGFRGWYTLENPLKGDTLGDVVRQLAVLRHWLRVRVQAKTFALLPGERWWGGGGGDGQNQPYGDAPSARIDLHTCGDCSAPLLVSSAGRVIWSERPFAYMFGKGTLLIESADEALEPKKVGTTLREAYLHAAKAHFHFEGKLPPEVFFSLPQWNNWIEIFLCGMNQKGTDDYTAELAASGFPCGIYMVDGGWLSHQGSYEFHTPDFPDPKGMIGRIRAQGWVPLIWTANFVSPDSREYKRLRWHEAHTCLDVLTHRRGHGHEAAIVTWWSGKSCVYDLMRKEGYDYYVKTLRDFCAKYGLAGFKFDAGDAKGLSEECDFGPGLEAVDYVNRYAHLAATEFPYHEIRVGWKNGGEPNVLRLKDRAHAWQWRSDDEYGQLTIVPQMIAAGLLGAPYAVADMVGGGLEVSFLNTKISETVFVRSAQLQAMMPMMQFSAAPWRRLSKRGVELCRAAAERHVAMAPYILACARATAKTGEPIVRAMEYEFPNQGFARPMQQYMLGPDYLVAPVLNDEGDVTVELPAGDWTDDLGETHTGPKKLELKGLPLERMPVYRVAR